MATSETQKRHRAERTRVFLEQITDLYPACFSREAEGTRPLAIGIQQQLRDDLPHREGLEETPAWLIRQALALYTRSPAYLEATIARHHRIHLDGSHAGEISDEAVAYARERLEQQKQRRKARKQQARRAPKARRPSPDERKQQKLQALARKFNHD